MNRERFKTDFMRRLEAEGETVSGWARQHGYLPSTVSQVLNGQRKGRYGLGHEIAVALGMKPRSTKAAS